MKRILSLRKRGCVESVIVMGSASLCNGVKYRRHRGMLAGSAFAMAVITAASLLGSCGEKKRNTDRADVLIEFGDSALTATEVLARIPSGLAPEDSAAMFQKIVQTWVEEMLLTDMAEERIDNLDEIEEKVAAYRRQLIVGRYLRMMRDNNQRKAEESHIRSYYDAHSAEMKLETPAVKGIYVKVPSNTDRLDDIRKWVKLATDAAVDNLEKYGLGQALQYDYFKDRWIDWQTIAEAIPYRFSDPDAFLSTLVASTTESDLSEGRQPATRPARGYFETESGGSVYMLHISSWLPSGSPMPYEFAAGRIAAMLEEQDAAESQRRLIGSLYKRAKKEKSLRLINYDPGLDK